MIRRTITLKAKPALKSKYQALLKEDWGKETGEQAIRLIDELMRGSGIQLAFPRENSGKTVRVKRQENVLGANELREALHLLAHFRLPHLPAVDESRYHVDQDSRSPLVAEAWRATTYLVLQSIFEVHGEAGFFRDLQTLLYLNIVDGLLPELHSAETEKEHYLLLAALGYHCTAVWPDEAAHQQYLLSILARYIGDRDLEDRALLASFRLADPEEHDYLTLAQSYWLFLLENQRYEDAETFLLDIYRRAPRESLDEIKKMIGETFSERVAAG